jgi:hypothetical protein
MDREEYEELAFQAHDLQWALYYRRREGERVERIYWRAVKRYVRRARDLEDYDLMRMESSIEASAYE